MEQHPIDKLNVETFDEIQEIQKIVTEAVKKSFEKENPKFKFIFKGQEFEGDTTNPNFYMGWLYGCGFFSETLNKELSDK